MQSFKKAKYACYSTYPGMTAIFALPPLLFVTFRQLYSISYTQLGTLVLINFCTQLGIDLVFTFFSHRFPIARTVRIMPVLTAVGMAIYGLSPWLFPDSVYVGLVIGTFLFSVSAGLSEVLLSPLIAAIPSDNPQREMSLLHSLYAFGVLFVTLVSTLFFLLFGRENWQYLTLFYAVLPLVSHYLFCTCPLPDIQLHQTAPGEKRRGRAGILALCVLCIFFGSAAENTMSNWVSAFMETAVGLPKAAGDILGLALFALFLGFGRILHAKRGGNITTVLLVGMIGSAGCYLVTGLSPLPVLSMIACMLTGFFASMLWPGTLIMMEEKCPSPGIAAYALMAASGDFGASVAPQLAGAVTDTVTTSPLAAELLHFLSGTPEQVGMKSAMLLNALFPLAGILLLLYIRKKLPR